MTGSQDKFWQIFFVALLAAVLFVGMGFVLLAPHSSSSIENVAFELESGPRLVVPSDSTPPRLPAPLSGYLYRDTLVPGFYEITWQSEANWRSTEKVYEGTHTARLAFIEDWSGVGIGGDMHNIAARTTLRLALYTEPGITELYLELYNSNNGTVGRKAVSTYVSGGLVPGVWHTVAVPLADFGAALPKNIAGFALIAETPGVAHIDAIELVP